MTPAYNDGEVDEGILKAGESVVHVHVFSVLMRLRVPDAQLARHPSWMDELLGLLEYPRTTAAGKVIALEALRARGTGPRSRLR